MSEQPRTADPFIGLEPFTEAESDRFFGREAQTRILVHKIRANKLTLLVAASGVGKSSLLEAGVKPALRTQGGHALLSFRTWYGDPLAELKAALAAELPGTAGRPALDPGQPLAVLLRLHALIGGQPLILFLDQFEELFNYQRLTGRLAPLVQELSEAINDRDGPAALVISMREDFAMELNVFKPLVNSVFDNYYRLEKLDLDQARAAMVRPLTDRGWDYEVVADGRSLADTLLDDLGHRESRERLGVQQLADPAGLALQVEPPHLQIVCRTLWDLDRGDPGQRLRLATYLKTGTADGILDGHFRRAMAGLSHEQRRLASRAFDYLVGQQGTKLAYPVDELAERCHAKPAAMDAALAALDRARVLRRSERVDLATGQTRLWFELYHDVFARSVHAWNRDFKAGERRRHTALALAGVILAFGLAYLALDLWSNREGRYLALSPLAGLSDRIEVRGGAFDLPTDLLGQGGFLYESDRVRGDIEADRRFDRARIADRPETEAELIARLPIADRLPAYGRDGLLTSGLGLVHLVLTSKERQRDQVLIDRAVSSLSKVRHPWVLGELIRVSREAPEPGTRSAAVDSTAGLGTPEGLEVIAARLEDQDANVRRAAIEALARLGATQAADAIAARLEDQDSFVRQAAIEALARLEATQTTDAIAARLEHEDSDVRQATIEALAGLRATQTVDAIARRLEDHDSGVRRAAVEALAGLGATQTVDAIATQLEDQDSYVRRAAVEALAGLGATQTVDAIAAQLEDQDPDVRRAAIKALAGLGATQTVDAIAAQLEDQDPDVRRAVIKALAGLGATQTADAIAAQVEDQDSEVRQEAIEALTGLGATQAANAIAARLEDQDSNVRRAAIKALAGLGATQAADAIAARLGDQDSGVRRAAIEALADLGATQAAEAIAARLASQDSDVRRAAIWVLAGLGATQAADAIAARLEDQDSNVRRAAVEALAGLGATQAANAIAARLGDQDSGVRRAAIEALAGLGATQTADAIAARLEDQDSYVRRVAIEALTGLGATQTADAIAARLEGQDSYVRRAAIKALAGLGATQTADAIAAQLEDQDSGVRQAAIAAMAGLGATQAADAIAARLEDQNSVVRQAAIEALDNLRGGPQIASAPFDTDPLVLARAWAALGRPWSQERASRLFAATAAESKRSSRCPTVGASGGPPAAVAWCADRALSLVGEDRPDAGQIAELGDLATAPSAQRLFRALGEQDADAPEILEALARIGALAPNLIVPHLDNLLALARKPAQGIARSQTQAAAIRALGQIHAFRGQTRPENLPDLDRRIGEALASLPIGLNPKEYLMSLATLDALGLSGRPEAMNRLRTLVEQHQDSTDPIWVQRLYPKALFWLGRVGYPPAIEPLAGRLEALAQAKAQWRRARDQAERRSREGTPRANSAAPGGEDREARFLPWPHQNQEFALAYAITRADPSGHGIALLNHPLHEARRGAVQALASGAPPPVFAEVLRRLQAFDADRLPHPFPTAAYRVLDGGLHVLELGDTTDELAALDNATAGVCDAVSPIVEADVAQAAITPAPALEQIQRAACDRLRWTLKHADFNSLVRDRPPPAPPSP